MAFPTIPTAAATRALTGVQANTTATRATADLTGLTKNSGDLLIAIFVGYQTSTGTNAAFSGWTAGWTEFHDSATSTTMAIGAAYKWSTGSETGTVTATQAGTITGHAAYFLLSIPGAHATSPPEAGGRNSGTTTAANATTVTPSWGSGETLWIAVGGTGEDATTGSFTAATGAPTNYTNFLNSGITSDVVGGLDASVAFRQLTASSEDAGAFAGVDVSNTRSAAITIAVRNAPIAYTQTVTDTAGATDSRTVNFPRTTSAPTIRETAHNVAVAAAGGNAAVSTSTSSAPQVGDLLVAACGYDYESASMMVAPTGANGVTWTQQLAADSAGNTGAGVGVNLPHTKVWTATVGTAGVQTVTANTSGAGAGNDSFIALYVITGHDPTTPVEAVATSNEGGTAQAPPSIAPSAANNASNALLLCGWFTGSSISAGNYTPQGSMTEQTEDIAGVYDTFTTASEALTATGDTGTRSASWVATGGGSATVLNYNSWSLVVPGAVVAPGTSQTTTDTAGAADSQAQASSAARSQTDTAAAADSATTAAVYAQTVTDTAGAVDSQTQVAVSARSQTDTAGAVDSQAQAAAHAQTIIDSAGAVDSRTQAAVHAQTVTDTAGAADSRTQAAVHVQSVTDTAGAVDSQSQAFNVGAVDYTQTVTDTVGATDSTAVVEAFVATVTDTAGAADSQTQASVAVQAVIDTAGAADAIQVSGSGGVQLDDPTGVTDSISQAATFVQTVTDAAGAADSVTRALTRELTDTAGATDTAAQVAVHAPSIVDTAGTADDIQVSGSGGVQLTDAAGAADSTAQAAAHVRALTDTAFATDATAVVEAFAATVTDTAGATDSRVQAAAHVQSVTDTAGVTDSSQVSGSGGVQLTDAAGATDSQTQVATHVRALTDTAGAADGRSTELARTLTDTAGATDPRTQTAGHAPVLTDTAGVTDSAAWTSVTARTVIDTVGAADTLGNGTSTAQTLGDVAGIADDVLAARAISVQITDAVAADDNTAQMSVFTPTVTDTAGAVDTVSPGRVILLDVIDAIGVVDSRTAGVVDVRLQVHAAGTHGYGTGPRAAGHHYAPGVAATAFVDHSGLTATR